MCDLLSLVLLLKLRLYKVRSCRFIYHDVRITKHVELGEYYNGVRTYTLIWEATQEVHYIMTTTKDDVISSAHSLALNMGEQSFSSPESFPVSLKDKQVSTQIDKVCA